jgi:phosphatidylethanolamine/phosphatidyl-N-methylethanolamine N-methyltransferase
MPDRVPESAEPPAKPARSYGAFLRAFIRDRRTIGAVAPTSRGVGRRIAQLADIGSARRVAEFGPGTGAITHELLAALPADGRIWAFELHAPFVEHLRTTVDDPRLQVVPESAETIGAVREQAVSEGFDAIVSSIPFSLIGRDLTPVILRAAHEALRPGGVFVALQYHPRFLPPFLRAEFGRVERELYLWNIPPATLLHVRHD